jgi:glutaredoxin
MSSTREQAVFYHAGCPVCVSAENQVAKALDPSRYDVQYVDLRTQKQKITEAETAHVQSVPALVIGGQVFHINYGAALSDLR